MERVAVFVDAGYLFAQGSVAISGSKRGRNDVAIDPAAALQEFKVLAKAKAPDAKLLRVYWYDGTPGYRPTVDQARIGELDDVKLRLGSVNSAGQQKGVDSLIVTDLIELARQKAICDAVLMSGDEDVRVGVQIAQNYGVRVHLVGIFPARASQSNALMQEVDTRSEWGSEIARRFLSLRATAPSVAIAAAAAAAPPPAPESVSSIPGFDPRLELAVKEFVEALEPSDIEATSAYWKTARGVPPELDGNLLRTGGAAVGHSLERDQKRFMRTRFQKMVTRKAGS